MARLSYRGVEKSFGKVKVLREFTLDVEEGEFVALLGPSGCGKSTALRLLAGFDRPDRGTIRIGGEEVGGLPAHRRGLGVVFQDYALFPDRSIAANIAYGLRARRLAGDEVRRRVEAILQRVGLADLGARRPADLSGGQRQRVALARALVIDPQAVLLDEPLSALDAAVRGEMRTFIKEVQQSFGKTTLFVTHDQEEALSLSDRVAVMAQGRIVEIGTPREIFEAPRTATVAGFVGANSLLPVQALVARESGCLARVAGGLLPVEPPPADARALVLCLPAEHVEWGPPEGEGPVGRVIQNHYLGRRLDAVVQLEGGGDVRLSAPPGRDLPPVGAAICLRLRRPARLLDACS